MFHDRSHAGRRLAAELMRFRDTHPVVLALPRGGVPVGFEIAAALQAPLDVVLVRKLGAPGFEELAIGAIAEGDPVERVVDAETIALLNVPGDYLDREIERQKKELERRRIAYRGDRPALDVHASTAIVVDDGIATGATMRAALRSVRWRHPSRLVMAVPVGPPSTLAAMHGEADELVCLQSPELFEAISPFYEEFHQLADDEVTDLLHRAAAPPRPAAGAPRQ
jgi:putative phosphoribosyl transferase